MATVYDASIDREQITGAFALAVDVRFDDLGAGPNQKVFDFNNGAGVDNIWLGQIGTSNDIEFVVIKGDVTSRVVATNAIVEGEYATWRVGVDLEGNMRIAKNADLLIEEGRGANAVPSNLVRANYQVGEGSEAGDSDLAGLVLNLKLANYGDLDELNVISGDSPCAITGEATCLCDKLYPDGVPVSGETGATLISETDAEGDGEWSAPQSLDVIPIHAIVMPDGKVLSYGNDLAGGARFVYSIYDPETGIDVTLPNTTNVDLFCSYLTIDPTTGNVLMMGGDSRPLGYGPEAGEFAITMYDYKTQSIEQVDDMAYARWYGTSVTLANGDTLVMGGSNLQNQGSSYLEVYNPGTGPRTLTGAELTDIRGEGAGWWYPYAWVGSDGDVFLVEGGGTHYYRVTTDGDGTITRLGSIPFGNFQENPAIMFDVDKIAMLDNGGRIWVADISEEVPSFENVAALGAARGSGGMVILPDGRVAFVGGSSVATSTRDLGTANRAIQIWDPETNEIVTEASASIARLYHSTHLLLPDGTIWSGGGGRPGPIDNYNTEIFAPSYLYDGNGDLELDRPRIVDAPSNIGANETFQITVSDSALISRITAVKSGGMTHAHNMDARFLDLEFVVIDGTTIEVSTPNGHIMLPGLWMMFALDVDGTPSIANMLGVDMAEVSETPRFTTADGQTSTYAIDDDQIDGAFEITVEARFDEVDGRSWQRVFDFGNGSPNNNVLLTQDGGSNDMRFSVFIGTTAYTITAANSIVEGELAKWTVGVDASGYMRMWKDDLLVAEGQGAVPLDVERNSNLVAKSNWGGNDDLIGLVRYLEVVNENDAPEYIHFGVPKATLIASPDVVEGNLGETTQMVFTLQLDDYAPNIVTGDVVITGNATGPAQVVIPSGENSAQIVLTIQGDNADESDEEITVTVENLNQARAGDLSATAVVINDDGPLLANGDFAAGIADWTVLNPTGGPAPAITGSGQLALNNGNEANYGDGVSQTIATVAGSTYRLSLEASEAFGGFSNHTVRLQALDDDGAVIGQKDVVLPDGTSQTIDLEFIAVGRVTTVAISNPFSTNSTATDLLIDNVSLTEIGPPQPLLSLEAPEDAVEGAAGESGALVFTVALDQLLDRDVTADVAVSGGTTAPTITIPAGSTAAEITVVFEGDDIYQGNRPVTVTLSNVDGALPVATTATATIIDDDAPVIPDGVFFFEGHYYLEATPDLAWDEAVAEANALGGTLLEIDNAAETEFILGAFGATAPIWLGFNDAEQEGIWVNSQGEQITYTNWSTGNPSNGSGYQHYAAIATVDGQWDDTRIADAGFFDGGWLYGQIQRTIVEYESLPPALVSISAPASVVEGELGFSGQMVFAVSLSRPVGQDVVADVAITGGVTGPGQIVIPAGETSVDLILGFAGDTTQEEDEPITVTLSNVVGALGRDLSATALILDDDGPLLSNGDFSDGLTGWDVLNPTGGNAPGITAGEQLALNGGDEASYGDGVAQDVVTTPGATYRFAADASEIFGGSAVHTVRLEARDATDQLIAQKELQLPDGASQPVQLEFTATGTLSTVRILNPVSTGTQGTDLLIDNVTLTQIGLPLPNLSISAQADTVEGGTGDIGDLVFAVVLSRPTDKDVTADVAASAGVSAPTVTIPAGSTTAEITVVFEGDDIYQGDRPVTVTLSNVDGALPVETTATATIIDDDPLIGTAGDDIVVLLDGNDFFLGLAGNDSINGGSGADTLDGGSGSDTVAGGPGDDFVHGKTGADQIDGGDGNDRVFGGGGNDILQGDSGDDYLNGGANLDTLSGGEGNDTLIGEIGKDLLDGGAGNDSIAGGNANDTILGGQGSDTLIGQGQADLLNGGSGNDLINGGASADTLLGGADNDTLNGGAYNDSVMGDDGADSVFGGSGLDFLDGGTGNDFLDGGSGKDTVQGGDGADTALGGIGDDYLEGGADEDSLNGGAGNDTLDGGSSADVLFGGIGADVLTVAAGEGGDTLSGDAGADRFDFETGFGTATIMDFTAQDVIDLVDVSAVDGFGDLTIVYGADAQIDLGSGDALTLVGVTGGLSAGDFIF